MAGSAIPAADFDGGFLPGWYGGAEYRRWLCSRLRPGDCLLRCMKQIRRGRKRNSLLRTVRGDHIAVPAMRILKNPDRNRDREPSGQRSPAKDGQAEPPTSSASGGNGRNLDLCCGQSQSYNISTIATGGQVLDYAAPFAYRKRLLGEGREHICIGMRAGYCGFSQPLQYELGNVLHLKFLESSLLENFSPKLALRVRRISMSSSFDGRFSLIRERRRRRFLRQTATNV